MEVRVRVEVRVDALHIMEGRINLVLLDIINITEASWELALYTMAVAVMCAMVEVEVVEVVVEVEVVCAMEEAEVDEEVEVEGPAECCWCISRIMFKFAEICSMESFEKQLSSPYQCDFHIVIRVDV